MLVWLTTMTTDPPAAAGAGAGAGVTARVSLVMSLLKELEYLLPNDDDGDNKDEEDRRCTIGGTAMLSTDVLNRRPSWSCYGHGHDDDVVLHGAAEFSQSNWESFRMVSVSSRQTWSWRWCNRSTDRHHDSSTWKDKIQSTPKPSKIQNSKIQNPANHDGRRGKNALHVAL